MRYNFLKIELNLMKVAININKNKSLEVLSKKKRKGII
jgi:hypothetical protein